MVPNRRNFKTIRHVEPPNGQGRAEIHAFLLDFGGSGGPKRSRMRLAIWSRV
jgi:hypothetical protein